MYSLIIPVYRNEESIPELLNELEALNASLGQLLEVVFVVDGSPDRSYAVLRELIPTTHVHAQLLLLSRNFGSFAAIRAGLAVATGPYYAVMAADLQEPTELAQRFFQALASEPVDVVIGTREGRDDPISSKLTSGLFWALYRRLVLPELPVGGVDVFGCNQAFRDHLIALEEINTSLVALIFWIGFRRKSIPYVRQTRRHGRSAWTFRRKLKYLSDSIFGFTDLPIRLLFFFGSAGLVVSMVLGIAVALSRLTNTISVPGYSATILTITFFGALNTFGLGILGAYTWRAFENTKRRPGYIVFSSESINPPEGA